MQSLTVARVTHAVFKPELYNELIDKTLRDGGAEFHECVRWEERGRAGSVGVKSVGVEKGHMIVSDVVHSEVGTVAMKCVLGMK